MHGNTNTLRPRQNGRYFADDTFKRIFLKENVRISITISLKFVPKSPIDNIPTLFRIMAWRRPGDKPLSEAMMVSLLTHICVARPQWVKRTVTLNDICQLILCIFFRGWVAIVQSSLVQLMDWCHRARSYYLSLCWSKCMPPCAQCVNSFGLRDAYICVINLTIAGSDNVLSQTGTKPLSEPMLKY